MSNASANPHIYKKDKYVKLKSLEPVSSKQRQYYFATDDKKSNIKSIAAHCNNLNVVVAKNWLKLSKLLSYLGLEKDESEAYSKNKLPFGQFFKDLTKSFQEGGDNKEEKTNLLPTLQEMSNRIGKISEETKKLAEQDTVTNKQLEAMVKDFDKRLKEIQDSVKAIVG
nr:Aphid transmission factor protein [Dahlia mosaic virus]